jgi:hypothetical protein
VLEAYDRKIAAVEGKDRAAVFAFREVDEGSVGELNDRILIAAHDRGDGGEVVDIERKQAEDAVVEPSHELVEA